MNNGTDIFAKQLVTLVTGRVLYHSTTCSSGFVLHSRWNSVCFVNAITVSFAQCFVKELKTNTLIQIIQQDFLEEPDLVEMS